jgi:ABC-type phosphate/phosphonate transport system substrate-binding protein
MTAIATLIRSIDGRPYKQFGGVLFTLRGSPVKTLEEVRGARVMRVKATSFGGGISAWRLFVDNGILPGADFSYTSGNSHDSVVFEVRDAKSDVGVVRTGILESMHAEGAIDKDMFRIIHAVDDDFPQVHSTRLYPEWPMAACPWTRRKLAKEMAVALIALPPNTTAAENAQCFGWAPPLDYSPVEECLAVVQEAIRAQKEKEGSAEKPAEDVAEPANPPVKETPGGTASS